MKVMCDKCGHQVDRMFMWHDKFVNIYHMRAFCHGSIDEAEINGDELTFEQTRALEDPNLIGHAFTKPRINILQGRNANVRPVNHF